MFHGPELLPSEKYEINLSNEVLNFNFGLGAAKISKVKVGGQKTSTGSTLGVGASVSDSAKSAIFFSTFNFDLKYFCNPFTKMNV